MSKSPSLFDLDEFNELHHNQLMSIIEIAEKFDTYPNKIRRLAKKLGANIRNKSEAQEIALKTGRLQHPTKGKERSASAKEKISEALANYWDNMDDDEKTRRSNLSKEQWKNMSDEEKENFRKKAYEKIREAAKTGSKLEKQILNHLIKMGLVVKYHQQHFIANEKMHLDIMIPELKTIIEVDGPSHFKPIWGNDILSKSIDADNRKDGLLLNIGFCVIRVRQKKDLTNKLSRDILKELTETLHKIKKQFPPAGKRKIIIGD